MTALISLLLPTRGRPELARRFLQSVADTTANLPEVEVILYVDDDDTGSHGIDHPAVTVRRIIGSRMNMGDYNSECFRRSSGDIIVLANDDMVIRTQGWDERLRQVDDSVPDRIYLAYCNDLFKKGDLCTFPILSRKCCDLLREPYHRAYRGAFIDYHLMDIFKRVGKAGYQRIFYLDDVVFEHLHYRTGKSEKDEIYTARGRFDDDIIFVDLAPVRAACAGFLVDAIEGAASSRSLPAYASSGKLPSNPLVAIALFMRVFLFDKALPFRWRFFLWWWFTARYVASHVL
jgi:glycosyltransferase involved in cell wall biosynthesis